jgi:hypothetical protein
VPTPFLPQRFNVHRTVDIRIQARGYVRDRRNDSKGTNAEVIEAGGGVYVPRAKYEATPHWVE